MALSAGYEIGPYRIIAAIEAGGMGEVDRGRDTKLDRDVAIAVCPRLSLAIPRGHAPGAPGRFGSLLQLVTGQVGAPVSDDTQLAGTFEAR